MLTPQPMATSSIRVRPTLQPTGSMMLKRMITITVKAACPATKEIMEGAMPDTRTASGSRTHSSAEWSATPMVRSAPDDEPQGRSPDGPQGGRAGAQRIGAEHRHGAEDHPEAVLDVGDLDDRDRERQADRTPQGVAEPHRAEGEVGQEPVGEEVRRRGVAHPEAPIDHCVRARRLEGGIGHHLGGDPQRPRVEPGVERGGDAPVLARRGVGTGATVRRMGIGLGEGGDVGGKVGVDQLVEPRASSPGPL